MPTTVGWVLCGLLAVIVAVVLIEVLLWVAEELWDAWRSR